MDHDGTRAGPSRPPFIAFGESDLLPASGAPRRENASPASDGYRLVDFADDLASAPDGAARGRIVRAALRVANFDALCYLRVTRIGETVSRLSYFDSYAPAGWPQRYLENRFFESDMRVAAACRQEWPLLWDRQSLDDAAFAVLPNPLHDEPPRIRTSTAARSAPESFACAADCEEPISEQRTASLATLAKRFAARSGRFAAAAREAGLRSGVSFGLAIHNTLDIGVLHFAAPYESKALLPDTAVGHAYAIGAGLHRLLLERAPHVHPQAQAGMLTGVQREILELVTGGLNAKDIAARLVMSRHNVDYHLSQLKKRFGAENRAQLAYIARRMRT